MKGVGVGEGMGRQGKGRRGEAARECVIWSVLYGERGMRRYRGTLSLFHGDQ